MYLWMPGLPCDREWQAFEREKKEKKEALRVFLMPFIAHWPLGLHVDLLFIIIHGQLYVLGTLLCCRPSPINEFRLLAIRSDCQPPQPSLENNGAGLAGHTM